MIDLVAVARAELLAQGFEPDPPAAPATSSRAPSVDRSEPGIADLRDRDWSSIDNEDSRDLDQIELAEPVSGGGICVHVGIADVQHLVSPGSPDDHHAANNTTSVYTGPKVFPMLRESLSTDLTSLLEGQDRLAIVTSFTVTADGDVTGTSVQRAWVRNRARLVYEDVGAWLEGGAAPQAIGRSTSLAAQLRLQQDAAERLRGWRERHGALELDRAESRLVMKDGAPVDLRVVARNKARALVENFMIATNVAVARFLESHGRSSIRRVVRSPKRWPRLVHLAERYGEKLPAQPDLAALGAFVAKRRKADPEGFQQLSVAVLKLLGGGEYVLERPGDQSGNHFALALKDYAHSTAPNRRYADLIIQRLIVATLRGGPPPYTDGKLQSIAARCTRMEDLASTIERRVQKRAAASLLDGRIGAVFDAMVTGKKPDGIFARLRHPSVEGRIVRGGDALDVGDEVRVRLVAVDDEKGWIDLEVAS